METLYRLISGAVAGIVALFAPIGPLFACAVIFIGIDFVSGVTASRAMAKRAGQTWYFESRAAWHTIVKLTLTVVLIALTWLLDTYVFDFIKLNLAKIFTGFVCGIELWSFLENAAQISDAKIFVWLRQYVHRRLEKELGDE